MKQFAEKKELNILQPPNLKNQQFQDELRSLNADLQIVVAFRMLPEAVWAMPSLGTFNLHASLLPQYRGAAPIHWAVINGEKETGLTTFFLKHEIDTGNIILQEKIAITKTDTTGTLHDRMMEAGAKLVLQTTNAIQNQSYDLAPQNEALATKKAPKIFKENCEIDWNQPTEKVYNFIRGLNPYPTAWTILAHKTLKIFFGEKEMVAHKQVPGEVVSDEKTYLKFATKDGFVNVTDLQLAGKKRMLTEEFLRGFRLQS